MEPSRQAVGTLPKRDTMRIATFLLSGLLLLSTAAAHAEQEPEEPASGLGLTIDVGFATAYFYRGLNVFSGEGMMEQHGFVAPSLTWSVLDGKLQFGYWGAWQVMGGNVGENIDAGLGAENDFSVSYDHALTERLTLSPGLGVFLYPLAEESAAGTRVPTILEPTVGLTWDGPLEIGLRCSYFLPTQQALLPTRHLYLNPTIGKSFELTRRVGLTASAGFGYKALAGFEDNVFDALVTVAAPVALGLFSVTPAVSFVWTNFDGLGLAEEVAVFGGVNAAVSL